MDQPNAPPTLPGNLPPKSVPSSKRLCRFPGCPRVIKSQGHCQRHGAKAKRCRVDGCDKQAQGTHDGMCKRHWKAANFPNGKASSRKKEEPPPPPEPQGDSVYDNILPQSIAFRPSTNDSSKELMPLVTFLKDGRKNFASGWHRKQERLSRGLHPVPGSSQLDGWERQLALCEILLLSGGTRGACFMDLSHAWGREKHFHHTLAAAVCERRGEVYRKKRPAEPLPPSASSAKKPKVNAANIHTPQVEATAVAAATATTQTLAEAAAGTNTDDIAQV